MSLSSRFRLGVFGPFSLAIGMGIVVALLYVDRQKRKEAQGETNSEQAVEALEKLIKEPQGLLRAYEFRHRQSMVELQGVLDALQEVKDSEAKRRAVQFLDNFQEHEDEAHEIAREGLRMFVEIVTRFKE
jgi:hypothetical protein